MLQTLITSSSCRVKWTIWTKQDHFRLLGIFLIYFFNWENDSSIMKTIHSTGWRKRLVMMMMMMMSQHLMSWEASFFSDFWMDRWMFAHDGHWRNHSVCEADCRVYVNPVCVFGFDWVATLREKHFFTSCMNPPQSPTHRCPRQSPAPSYSTSHRWVLEPRRHMNMKAGLPDDT